MIKPSKVRALLALTTLTALHNAHAGRPMITDDATLLEKNHCQLEIWGENYHHEDSYWFIPACHFHGGFEMALGVSRHQDKTEDQAANKIIIQAKTLFKQMEQHGYGLGLIVGSEQPTETDNQADYYVNVPLSWAPNPNQPYTLHANLGTTYAGNDEEFQPSWALALDFQLSHQTLIFAETFDNHQGQFAHIGLAYSLIPERLQFDISYGNHLNNRQHGSWITFGLAHYWKP